MSDPWASICLPNEVKLLNKIGLEIVTFLCNVSCRHAPSTASLARHKHSRSLSVPRQPRCSVIFLMPLEAAVCGDPVQAPLALPLLDQLELLLALCLILHFPRAAMACRSESSFVLQVSLCYATTSAMIVSEHNCWRTDRGRQGRSLFCFSRHMHNDKRQPTRQECEPVICRQLHAALHLLLNAATCMCTKGCTTFCPKNNPDMMKLAEHII